MLLLHLSIVSSQVFMAKETQTQTQTQEIVALKKIRMDNEREGVSIFLPHPRVAFWNL
jgi:hypothetical protein